jgi:hypothetical protein
MGILTEAIGAGPFVDWIVSDPFGAGLCLGLLGLVWLGWLFSLARLVLFVVEKKGGDA